MRPELIVFDFHTGEWHQVAYFPLEDRPGQLAQPEKGARWMAVLSDQAGGQENAQKLIAEWQEMIAHIELEIVRRPVLW